MGLQKGGYKLRQDIRSDFSGEDVFKEYILPMIVHKDTNFQILNTDSVYGFVIVMTVNVSISKFVDDNEEPVHEFVIKICELHREGSKCGRTLRKAGELFKKSLSYGMFLREGETQQKIWGERLELGLKQICPAFTYSKIIENSGDGVGLIPTLVETLFRSDENIVKYLRREILVNSYDLGFMMMEKIEGDTLKSVPSRYDSTARFICAAAIELFLRHDVINTDMNQGNCILNQRTGEITMIDFGMVMTPKYLIECINSRGDQLSRTSSDNTVLIELLKNNLLEFQKLQFFFQEAHHKYTIIDTEQKVASMLTFLAHLESRFILMLHGPLAPSNMKQLVEHAIRGERPYKHILEIYRSLNRPVSVPATPLKEFMKVGYEPGFASVESPQSYFLDSQSMVQVNAEYESMWIPSGTGKALPSAEEFAARVKKMEEKLSDEQFFKQAIALGTPDSNYSCYSGRGESGEQTPMDSPIVDASAKIEQHTIASPHDGSTLIDDDSAEIEQHTIASPHDGSTPMDSPIVNDSAIAFPHDGSTPMDSPIVDASAVASPHDGSTPMDSPIVDDSAEIEPVRIIAEATRPDKKRKGATTLSGGRPRRDKIRITRRKRRTARKVFTKRKTRKQCKQKTRKIYKKTYN